MEDLLIVTIYILVAFGLEWLLSLEAWAETHDNEEPLPDYPIPPKGTTSYSSYSGRVVYTEQVDHKSVYVRGWSLKSKQVRIMMLVENPQGYQLTLERLPHPPKNATKLANLFTTAATPTQKQRGFLHN